MAFTRQVCASEFKAFCDEKVPLAEMAGWVIVRPVAEEEIGARLELARAGLRAMIDGHEVALLTRLLRRPHSLTDSLSPFTQAAFFNADDNYAQAVGLPLMVKVQLGQAAPPTMLAVLGSGATTLAMPAGVDILEAVQPVRLSAAGVVVSTRLVMVDVQTRPESALWEAILDASTVAVRGGMAALPDGLLGALPKLESLEIRAWYAAYGSNPALIFHPQPLTSNRYRHRHHPHPHH